MHVRQQRVDRFDDRLVDLSDQGWPRSANSSIWAVMVAMNTPAVNGSTGRARSARRARTSASRRSRSSGRAVRRRVRAVEDVPPRRVEFGRVRVLFAAGAHPQVRLDLRTGDAAAAFALLPHRGLVREAAHRWFRAQGITPEVAAELDGHEGLLTLVALGCGTGVVPRVVLDHSAVRDRPAVLPAAPPPEPFPIGLCVRRADLRRPSVAALWSLSR
ncbi:LysR substrate-binding domain-containing protein [Streptomyces scabichelini]|uniref:LysR substrate-binding domain-containing protein n=1 Tax=Streptomyces scabichelini TaxID=2711217 RepID=UPI0030B9EC3A